MFTSERQAGCLALVCVMGIFLLHPALADDGALLPSPELQNAIRELPVMVKKKKPTPEPPYLTFRVDPRQAPLKGQSGVSLDHEGAGEVPFATLNVMILQFEPSVSAFEIQGYVSNRNLNILQTFPEIGAIQVEVDLRSYIDLESTGDDANQKLLNGLVKAINDFQKDPLIRVASPDLLLSSY